MIRKTVGYVIGFTRSSGGIDEEVLLSKNGEWDADFWSVNRKRCRVTQVCVYDERAAAEAKMKRFQDKYPHKTLCVRAFTTEVSSAG